MAGLVGPTALRNALTGNGKARGTWVQTGSPEVAHIAAASGFDFVIVDMQHGSLDLSAAAGLIGAIGSRGVTPIVRIPVAAAHLVGQVLDAGAHGVLVPDLRSADQAREMVAAARYAPVGTRGACPTVIATDHGLIPFKEYQDWCRDNVVVWGLIETIEAIDDLEGIAAAGLDALVMGPFDLSMAMGLDGRTDHPEVVTAMDRVVKAAVSNGIDCVAVLFDTDAERITSMAADWTSKGCRIITGLSDRWALTTSFSAARTALG